MPEEVDLDVWKWWTLEEVAMHSALTKISEVEEDEEENKGEVMRWKKGREKKSLFDWGYHVKILIKDERGILVMILER